MFRKRVKIFLLGTVTAVLTPFIAAAKGAVTWFSVAVTIVSILVAIAVPILAPVIASATQAVAVSTITTAVSVFNAASTVASAVGTGLCLTGTDSPFYNGCGDSGSRSSGGSGGGGANIPAPPGGSAGSGAGGGGLTGIPSCIFSANPSTLNAPQSVSLSWNCDSANTCVIDQSIGSVNAQSGSANVTPSKTTTYNLKCDGPAGSKSFGATINVNFSAKYQEVIPR